MRLPIDTQHLSFISVGIPEAVVDFDSTQPRHDPDGRASSSLNIVALGAVRADILIVKAAGSAQRTRTDDTGVADWPYGMYSSAPSSPDQCPCGRKPSQNVVNPDVSTHARS